MHQTGCCHCQVLCPKIAPVGVKRGSRQISGMNLKIRDFEVRLKERVPDEMWHSLTKPEQEKA